MGTKIHLKSPSRYTLDTTPLVGPDAAYCKKIGFTDGRSYCPVRTEGSADRAACETYAIGKAKDTGRPGPTWYRNGKLCTDSRPTVRTTRQPVPPVGLRRRPVRGLHERRRLRLGAGRPVSPVTEVRATVCEGGRVARNLTTRALWATLAASCLLAWACSLPDETPTEPEPVQSVAPTPTANPNPTPTPILGAPRPRPRRPRGVARAEPRRDTGAELPDGGRLRVREPDPAPPLAPQRQGAPQG